MKRLILQFNFSFLIRWFLKLFVGVKFHNATFLLDEKQFIIIANHNSHLDTMAIMASLPCKIVHKVKPVAAADFFGTTKIKSKLSNYFINTLLIPRKRDRANPKNDPIYKMNDILKQGYSLLIFPEGTRGKPEVQQPLKPGVALVLKENPSLKYIPAYMKGMGKALPKDDNLIVPYESSLIYGKPKRINSDKIEDILKQIEEDLFELKSTDYN